MQHASEGLGKVGTYRRPAVISPVRSAITRTSLRRTFEYLAPSASAAQKSSTHATRRLICHELG